ncbi:hypothetical protein [Nonomuraea rubra]|uniref:hypothetical protein n=1 Tax=Nonomuraea rubra TaxID=46180 RepID=UPI0033D27833
MAQPKKRAQPPPAKPERRLAAVPPEPELVRQPITVEQARRLLTRLAERAEADGDADAAAFWREQRDEVAPGYEFDSAALEFRVTDS